METWKIIEWYEEYEISSDGRVRSLLDNHWTFRKRVLKASINVYWYSRCSLFKNKNKKTLLIHRLAAQVFIPNPNNYPQINHINGIKTDNRIHNLEWCTPSENIQHAYESLNKRPPHLWKFQWNHPSSKRIIQLSIQGYEITKWDSMISAEEFTWISRKWISACCNWKIKTSWGFIWKFL